MSDDEDTKNTKSGEEAIREIREKGDDLSDEDREFLESEGVRLDPDDPSSRPVA